MHAYFSTTEVPVPRRIKPLRPAHYFPFRDSVALLLPQTRGWFNYQWYSNSEYRNKRTGLH